MSRSRKGCFARVEFIALLPEIQELLDKGLIYADVYAELVKAEKITMRFSTFQHYVFLKNRKERAEKLEFHPQPQQPTSITLPQKQASVPSSVNIPMPKYQPPQVTNEVEQVSVTTEAPQEVEGNKTPPKIIGQIKQ